MALPSPLRLKREVAPRVSGATSALLPIARVWVDSGVFHLDHIFDYLIPESLSSQIELGIRVVVPFNGREVEALVVERVADSSTSGLKSIVKVISPVAIATASTIALIGEVSARWGAHHFDVIRSAIPPRVAAGEKDLPVLPLPSSIPQSDLRSKISSQPRLHYRQLPAFRDPLELIAIKALKETAGTTLIIVPDSRQRIRLSNFLKERSPINLDSDLERSARYHNYLSTMKTLNAIVIGTRSAIFAPIPDLARIFIFDEGSEHFYERRTPGWNVRDVAFIRSAREGASLEFFGFSPSQEIARSIEEGEIVFSPVKSRVSVDTFPQEKGELLPGRIIPAIRKALRSGPVLFIAPRKGYSQSIICQKCRNISICQCGGKLMRGSALTPISCSHCELEYPGWRCSWCKSDTPFLLGRGADRFAQEIGAAFPGEKITLSMGENISDRYEEESGIVIATPGATPISLVGYSAIIILEAARFLSQADMRAHERSRALFFASACLLAKGGSLLLVLDHTNPIVGALSSWKPSLLSSRELRDRKEVHLPPYSRAITLDIEESQSSSLIRGLTASIASGRLPASTRILGPTQPRSGLSRILLLSDIEDGQQLVSLMHEFQRKRSIAKKPLASLRIDPYSLSR